jgi:two-component system response regulator YesN
MWKIVIVDDDRQVLQGMKRLIPWQELNVELVGEAMDGSEGAQLILERKPDIVITDIYMPVKNGLEMIEELRRNQYEGKFIILSGYSDFEYARQALRLNVDDYLSKPITLQTLKDVLNRTITDLEQLHTQYMEADEWKRKLVLYEPFVEQERIRAIVTGGNRILDKEPPLFNEEHRQDGQYLVVALEIFRNERVEGLAARDWNLFRFAVSNISKEISCELGLDSHFVELYGHCMALLLRFDPGVPEEEAIADALELARNLIQAVNKYLRIRLQAGIGSVKRHWREASDSTEEAFQALFAKKCLPDSSYPVFVYKKKSENNGRPFAVRPIQFYQEIADAIRHLEVSRADDVLTKWTEQLRELGEASAAEMQSMAREIRAIVSFTLYESGIVLEEACPQANAEREISEIVSPDQLKEFTMRMIRNIQAKFGRNENLRHKQAVDFMIRYIHENYAQDIRLAELAEKVYISRNYLSTIFRNATGETFNDYVTRVRMEKAKNLLLEGKLMVYEVADQVGYKNVPYFTTLFKKYTGRNPTEFVKK